VQINEADAKIKNLGNEKIDTTNATYNTALNINKGNVEKVENPIENETFVEKFKKTFVDTIVKINKNIKNENDNPFIIVGKDCKRENIWRNEFFPQYKANRANGQEDGFMGGPFFKMAYQDNLFEKGGAKAILKHPKLEADDCIAISVKNLVNRYPIYPPQ
jgi:5'-3' exonuclease